MKGINFRAIDIGEGISGFFKKEGREDHAEALVLHIEGDNHYLYKKDQRWTDQIIKSDCWDEMPEASLQSISIRENVSGFYPPEDRRVPKIVLHTIGALCCRYDLEGSYESLEDVQMAGQALLGEEPVEVTL